MARAWLPAASGHRPPLRLARLAATARRLLLSLLLLVAAAAVRCSVTQAVLCHRRTSLGGASSTLPAARAAATLSAATRRRQWLSPANSSRALPALDPQRAIGWIRRSECGPGRHACMPRCPARGPWPATLPAAWVVIHGSCSKRSPPAMASTRCMRSPAPSSQHSYARLSADHIPRLPRLPRVPSSTPAPESPYLERVRPPPPPPLQHYSRAVSYNQRLTTGESCFQLDLVCCVRGRVWEIRSCG